MHIVSFNLDPFLQHAYSSSCMLKFSMSNPVCILRSESDPPWITPYAYFSVIQLKSIIASCVGHASRWIDSKRDWSSGVDLIWATNSESWGFLSASGMVRRAATALIADRLSSSCFSYSCLTELALTFVVTVVRRGSTNLSSLKPKDYN